MNKVNCEVPSLRNLSPNLVQNKFALKLFLLPELQQL